MQRFLVLLLCGFACLQACKQDPASSSASTPSAPAAGKTEPSPMASPLQLGGQWIDMDFCSRANQYGSVLGAMNYAHRPYCFAFEVNPERPDSVMCYNGIESFNLAAKYSGDTLVLLNARPGKNLILLYDSQGDKSITMFDNTTENAQMDRFVKSKANARDGLAAFQTALNHNVFGGYMTPVGKNVTPQLMFTPGGLIQGLGDYDRYELCIAGDCFVAGDRADVVTFINRKKPGSARMFAYRYSAHNDTLTIYHLVKKGGSTEKGNQSLGGIAYRFLRKEQ